MATKNVYTQEAFMNLIGLLKRTGHKFVKYTDKEAVFTDIVVCKKF